MKCVCVCFHLINQYNQLQIQFVPDAKMLVSVGEEEEEEEEKEEEKGITEEKVGHRKPRDGS